MIVVVSRQTNRNKKTLQVYAIKCIDRKTEVRRVQTESVLVQWGCLHIPKLMVPLIPVKKLQNTVSSISFLWGDISSDRQMNCLLHKILKQKCETCPESI